MLTSFLTELQWKCNLISMDKDLSELIQYLDQKFTRIDQRFDEAKQDFVGLQASVDTYAKKADT